ncbi:MAG: hypothetical protein OHK0052_06960 [Anaerolineales bacterium]
MTHLETLLRQAETQLENSRAARKNNQIEAARRDLLRAAELLYQAAALSSGALREQRKQLAQQALEEAERLTAAPRSAARPTANNKPDTPRPPIPAEDDEQPASWLAHEKPSVRFADIAGLETVKEEIRLKLLYPFSHPEIAAEYRIQPGGGILLYGPPGTGKTLIARAVAGEIDAAFFAIKPSEIMSQWVGLAEKNIQRLFAEAAQYPLSVIFIDEMEALAPRRRGQGSTVMARVVPQILAELDGFEKRTNPLLLIGATNEPWAIDAAILRPGRLDRLIYIPPPDSAARQKILELNLRDVPLEAALPLESIAARTAGFSGADMAALARRARERVFTEAVRVGQPRPINLADFEALLQEIRPSVSPQDLALYEAFARDGSLQKKR